MPARTLRKIQRNFMVTIPPSMRRDLELHEGDVVEIEQTADAIVIRPVEIQRKAIANRLNTVMAPVVTDLLADLPENEALRIVQEEIEQYRGGLPPGKKPAK